MAGIWSGVWEGSYTYGEGKQDNTAATLLFVPASLTVVGHGADLYGEFSLSGKYDRSNNIHWTKTYIAKYSLLYTGKFETDASISGNWEYEKPSTQKGGTFKFHPKKEEPADLSSDWITILIDQMHKAIGGEPSIFTLGKDNLVWKNLSIDEIKVIFHRLSPPQFPDVLKIYYHTYRLAIQIADDSERNAKRHVYWQIALVNKFGAAFAKELGDAHEKGRPGTDEDNRVDELNNAVALQYVKQHPGVDPLTAANTLWTEKKLHSYQVAHPSHGHDEL